MAVNWTEKTGKIEIGGQIRWKHLELAMNGGCK